jgi:hypothetical protein
VHKPDAQFTVLYFMGSGVRIDVNGAFIAKPFVEMNANFISYDYHDFGRSDAPESRNCCRSTTASRHMNAMTKPETRRTYQAFMGGVYE